jgi:hypothetical protein
MTEEGKETDYKLLIEQCGGELITFDPEKRKSPHMKTFGKMGCGMTIYDLSSNKEYVEALNEFVIKMLQEGRMFREKK